MHRWVVLYDAECGFCRWSVVVLLRLDRRRRLRAVPIQGHEGDRLLAAVEPARRLESWHLRSPDGQVRSAGAALPPLLRLLPFGRAPAWLAERFPGAVERAYGWVSRHRGRLARLLGERARTADPRRGGRAGA